MYCNTHVKEHDCEKSKMPQEPNRLKHIQCIHRLDDISWLGFILNLVTCGETSIHLPVLNSLEIYPIQSYTTNSPVTMSITDSDCLKRSGRLTMKFRQQNV